MFIIAVLGLIFTGGSFILALIEFIEKRRNKK